MAGTGCSNNIVIDNQAMRDTGTEANVQNNTVIGTNFLRGSGVGSNIVALGIRAGFRGTSSLGTIGDGAVMIGANTCDMGSSMMTSEPIVCRLGQH